MKLSECKIGVVVKATTPNIKDIILAKIKLKNIYEQDVSIGHVVGFNINTFCEQVVIVRFTPDIDIEIHPKNLELYEDYL